MDNYGLTESEQETSLREYNHALFRNMASPHTTIWEINLKTRTVCVLQDIFNPNMEGKEYNYDATLKSYADTYIHEEDCREFIKHMTISSLNRLDNEEFFECRIVIGEDVVKLLRFVLTVSKDENNENDCVYFSAIDLHKDMNEITKRIKPENLEKQGHLKIRRRTLFAYIGMVVAVCLIVLFAYFGMKEMRQALYKEQAVNFGMVMDKIGENINDEMQDKWTEGHHIADLLLFNQYKDLDDFFHTLETLETELYPDKNNMIFMVDENGLCYAADGDVFRCVDDSVLSSDTEEPYVTTIPARSKYTEQILFTVKMKKTLTVDDIQFTHAVLCCDMKLMDNYFEIKDYGKEATAYIVHTTGGEVYRNESDNELSDMYDILSALENADFGFQTSYEQFQKDLNEGSSGCVYITYRDIPYYVAYENLDMNDWYAMMIVPAGCVGKNIESFLNYATDFTIVLSLIVIVIIISLVLITLNEKKRQDENIRETLKMAAYAVSSATEAQRDADRTKTKFLSSMSHDIRTPMNAIVGMTALALKRMDDKQYLKDCLDKITQASNQLLMLVNEGLDISKIETENTVHTEDKKEEEKEDKKEDKEDKEKSIGNEEKIAGLNIIVAEDNDLNWEVIAEMLMLYGVKTTRAENGQVCIDLLEKAEENAYDMVLMDVQMPVLNGNDATREIRKSNKKWVAGIPVIAMTADAFVEDVKSCLAAGMDSHLAKPVDFGKLFQELVYYREKRENEAKS